jgi:NAD-dependent deacetylase
VKVADELVASLRRAAHVVVFTGAGVSAESGIPTFRDAQTGLWRHFDAQALATPEAFERDPSLVWGWYEWRRRKVLACAPNAAHRAIASLAQRVPRLTLITQNVDDLHERAGSPDVVHLHGHLSRPYYSACGHAHPAPPAPAEPPPQAGAKGQPGPAKPEAEGSPGSPKPDDEGRLDPPRCTHCGGRIRPGVVWFGEPLPRQPWERAVDAAQACDAFLCVGTSSVVEPAAGLTRAAIAAGAVTIQVNIESTWLDALVTLSLRGPAGALLPGLVSEVWPGT